MDSDQQEVKTYRSIWAIIRIVCFYNIGSIYFGYSYVYFSAIPFNVIQEVFNMPFSKEIAQGILYGCVPFGAAIGGLLAERVLQKLSRKQTFFFFNALAALSAILIYTKNPYCLIISRILQGLCVGAYPGLAALMIRQLCPIQISVMMGSAQVLFINFGLFTGFTFSYILSKHFSTEYYLNLTFAVPIYLIAIQQILFHLYFQNETPKYQFLKGNYQKARNIISEIYLSDHQNQVYHRILKDMDSDYQALEEREKQYPKDSWKAVLICVCLALFHQLSGIGIILLYSSEIAATFFNNDPLLFSVMLCSTKLVSSVILNIVLRKHDQKPTALIGIFIISSALLTFYIGITHKNQFLPTTPYLLTAAILIHAFGFILAFSSMYSYFAQSLQPNKVPVMVSINELTNALLSSFFPTLRNLSGDPDCPPVFLVMFFCMVTAFIVCWKFMVRTQGKTQLQIREEYEAIKTC